jgi:hypothetical protein
MPELEVDAAADVAAMAIPPSTTASGAKKPMGRPALGRPIGPPRRSDHQLFFQVLVKPVPPAVSVEVVLRLYAAVASIIVIREFVA